MVSAVVAVNVELPKTIVRRTIDKDTAVPYGSLMKLTTGTNTVGLTDGDTNPFGGICMFEKLATDTDIIEIPCAMDGVWEISCDSSAIAVGETVSIDALNQVHVSNGTTDVIAGSQVGQAEQAKDSAERIRVRVGVMG